MIGKYLIFAILLLLDAAWAQSPGSGGHGQEVCQRLLETNWRSWKLQALKVLSELSIYPLHPSLVGKNASNMLGAALNMRPNDVGSMPASNVEFSLSVEGTRAELRARNWPRFQRAFISLKNPLVLYNLTLPVISVNVKNGADEFTEMNVRSTTRLFFPMRELDHDNELGLLVPLTGMSVPLEGFTPHFELQIVRLSPTRYRADEDLDVVRNFNGTRYQIDELLSLSTWPD